MKARYAVQALVYMASQSRDEGTFVARKIAEAEDIPQKFLEEILLDLRKEGILQSKAGKSGGYKLKIPAPKISLQIVFQAISDPMAVNSAQDNRAASALLDDVGYLLDPVEQELKAVRLNVLERVTIDQLVKRKAEMTRDESALDFQI